MPPSKQQILQQLKVLQSKREKYWQRIQTHHDLLADLDNKTKAEQFNVRCNTIDDTYKDFEDVQNKIIELNSTVEEINQLTDVLSTTAAFEELYFNIKIAQKSQESNATVSSPQPGATAPPIISNPIKPKLPQINIPVFEGAYESFSAFKSLFDALVHNQCSLTPIEKYSYLRSLVAGSALACIKGFSFCEENYQLAYQALVQQYSNKRVIANSICSNLWNVKPLQNESQLRTFTEVFNVSVEALKAVGIPNTGDFLILFMALRILDPVTRQDFENSWIGKKSVPQYKDLLEFVRGRVSVTDLISSGVSKTSLPKLTSPSTKSSPMQPTIKRTFVTNVLPSSSSENKPVPTCPSCNKPHRLNDCKTFLELPVPEKYNLLKSKHLCFSCLGPHSRNLCTSKFSCRQCGSKTHHTLLHTPSRDNGSPNVNVPTQHSTVAVGSPTSSSLTMKSTLSCNLVDPCLSRQVLLGTAIVLMQDQFGKYHDVRVLIDPGSMINIVTQPLVARLCLPTKPTNVSITGIGSTQPLPASGLVSCVLNSKHFAFSIKVEAVILPSISANIPALPVSLDVINSLSGVALADPQFFSPAAVQMLIGAQYYAELMRTSEPIIQGEPSLVPSNLGMLVMGNTPSSPPISSPQVSFFVSNHNNDITAQLKRFWEMEEMHSPVPESPEDVECERHFCETYCRDENGIYVVRLPFRDGKPPNFGNNRLTATSRLLKLEKRFECQPDLKTMYRDNIQGYLDVGHMVVANQPSDYILTHHGIVKDSSTTQLRVVFNPTEKASPAHPSLNESLMIGPKLQNDITNIMLNFRLHPIVLTADIKQMYRGIKLDPRDSPYQQILWRSIPNEPIQQLEIQRVCFGVGSSPFQALRVLKQLVKDEGLPFPLASRALDEDTYIDDICTGAPSLEDACRLRDELIALLSTAGFELRKWSCSNSAVLDGLPLNYLEKPHLLGDIETIRVLGLQWDPCQDAFIYCVDAIDQCETKRQVLSQIARIYDLSGFVSPVTIWMKVLMQRLWTQGLDWDEPMSADLLNEWNLFIAELPILTKIRIPRYILDTFVTPPKLVGFADASNVAIGAVVYIRVLCSDHRVLVHLIRAKTKVAPLKTLTIPRLELCAAHLLSEVIDSLKPFRQRLHITTLHLFSDSMVVLSWLNTPVHLLKIYVSNRVTKILDLTAIDQWAHISTELNPADLASRGCYPTKLVRNELWWFGPPFLKEPLEMWPSQAHTQVTNLPDLKETVSTLLSQINTDESGVKILERFSSFTRAKRIIAWLLRFQRNASATVLERKLGSLSVEELNQSENLMIRISQQFYFNREIHDVMGSKNPPSLRQLTPFLENDLLRVGGRLSHAPLPYQSRHPLIIPNKSHLANLIVRHYHDSSLHGGPKMVQCLVQRRYFIKGLRNLVRKVVFNCQTCFRFSAKPHEAIMSDLPISRFTQGRPFIHTGVDLAGPYSLKDGYRRNSPIIKGYFAIFVCFATKAIHLEALTSLSTDCFLASLDRFIARRGLPSNMFSDQGTNFKGAARVIDETYTFIQKNESFIIDHLSGREIRWTFNAPSNPSSGGLWEAGVKSVKHHLKRILHDRALHYEEFITFLSRIEAVLNSRPIGVPASCPVDDIQCLTPGHFLIGAPLVARPELNVCDQPSNKLSRWELLQQVTQHFWKRWAREYLHTLIQREKWFEKTENLKEGDVVILMVENQSPTNWPLARILRLLPAKDGVVRVVSLQTPTGTLTRPVRKLLPLPILH